METATLDAVTGGMTAVPVVAATGAAGISPMSLALVVAAVLAVVFTGLVELLKRRMATPSRRRVRLWALVISGIGAAVTGAVMAVAVGVPWQAAVVAAGGPVGSVVVNAVGSLILGEEVKPANGGGK